MSDPQLLELLDSGTRRLVRSVDAMTDDQWRQPSLLPGWSRAHVVAHLPPTPRPVRRPRAAHARPPRSLTYASSEARDNDIAALASASPSALRDRFLGSTDGDRRVGRGAGRTTWPRRTIERTPGGRRSRPATSALMRAREVEIHHADLALDYTAADWPPEFVVLLMDSRAGAEHDGEPFVAHATDLDRSWEFGTGGADGVGRRERSGMVDDGPGRRRRTDQRRRPGAEDGAVVSLHRST